MTLPGLKWETPRFTTLVNNGDPDNRLDVAIIGDGYTAGQQEMFNEDTQRVVDAFGSIEPMKTYLKLSPRYTSAPRSAAAIKLRARLEAMVNITHGQR